MNPTSVNLKSILGNPITTGNGTNGSGTFRVSVASDNTVNVTTTQFPSSLGQKTSAESLSTVGASDGEFRNNLVQIAGNSVSAGNGVNGTGVQRVTIATNQGTITTQLPSTLGQQTSANSLSIVGASNGEIRTNQIYLSGNVIGTGVGNSSNGTMRVQLTRESFLKPNIGLYGYTYPPSQITQRWDITASATTYTQGTGNTAITIGHPVSSYSAFYARSTNSGDAGKTFLVGGYYIDGSYLTEIITLHESDPTTNSTVTSNNYMCITEFSYAGTVGSLSGIVTLSAENQWNAVTPGVPNNHGSVRIASGTSPLRGNIGFLLIPPGYMLVVNSIQYSSANSASGLHFINFCRRSADTATSVYSSTREQLFRLGIPSNTPVFINLNGMRIPYKGLGTNHDVFWVEAVGNATDASNTVHCTIGFQYYPV